LGCPSMCRAPSFWQVWLTFELIRWCVNALETAPKMVAACPSCRRIPISPPTADPRTDAQQPGGGNRRIHPVSVKRPDPLVAMMGRDLAPTSTAKAQVVALARPSAAERRAVTWCTQTGFRPIRPSNTPAGFRTIWEGARQSVLMALKRPSAPPPEGPLTEVLPTKSARFAFVSPRPIQLPPD
jgi:hypothetical protein